MYKYLKWSGIIYLYLIIDGYKWSKFIIINNMYPPYM